MSTEMPPITCAFGIVAAKLKVATDEGRELLSKVAACPDVSPEALDDLANADETLRNLCDVVFAYLQVLGAAEKERQQ